MGGEKFIVENKKTDAEGKITINKMPKGEFNVFVSAEHYDSHAVGKVVDCDVYHCESCLPVVTAKLKHLIYNCTGVPLTLTIANKATLLPLEGARVKISADGDVLVDGEFTNKKGLVVQNVVTNTSFEIVVSKKHYETTTLSNVDLCCDMSDLTCLECELDLPLALTPKKCAASTPIVAQ